MDSQVDLQIASFSSKPTGFRATLKCSMRSPHDNCGKAQEAPVLQTHSRITLLACLQEVRNRIEQRHGSECVKLAIGIDAALAHASTPSTVAPLLQSQIWP